MATCVVVSLFTKPKTEAELTGLIWTRKSLSLPPEMREQSRGYRNPVIYWAVVTAAVLFFYFRYG